MRSLLLSFLLATPLFADVLVIPRNFDKPVTKMVVTVSTGDDALRRNSIVSAFVLLKDGRKIESKALNCSAKQQCAGLAARSNKTLEWVTGPKQSFTPEQIQRVGLAFKSGKGGSSEPADTWDLTAVTVFYVAGGATGELASVSYQGRNYRLKSGETWQSPVQPGGRRRGGGPPPPLPQKQ